jgi:hypothetical protein
MTPTAQSTGSKIINVQPIPKKSIKARELLATLCFYYPQYTLKEARKLPHKDVMLLLNTAYHELAKQNINLTYISSAPHGKKGTVKKIINQFQNIADQAKKGMK